MNFSKLSIQKMIAVSAMAMVIPLSAYAGHHGEGQEKQQSEMRHHHKHGGMGILKQLDLSDAQKEQIEQIKSRQRADLKASKGDRRAHRDEMESLVQQDTFDSAKAKQLIAQQQAEESAMKMSMLRTQHEIYKVLTPQQREKAKVIRAEWKEKRMKRDSKRETEKSGNAM